MWEGPLRRDCFFGRARRCRAEIVAANSRLDRVSPYQGGPDHPILASPEKTLLVPKLCLGTHLSSKLCFAAVATELPGTMAFPNGVWERRTATTSSSAPSTLRDGRD